MLNDPLLVLENFPFMLAIKLFFLFCIAGFIVFTFILTTSLRSLNKILFIKRLRTSQAIELFGLVYILAAVSLFVLALVIL